MRRDRGRQRAFELIHGRARLQRRHRLDEIGDRFRLRQIEASVQVRAQREFAGLGQPRARAPSPSSTIASSSTGLPCAADLDDVFAGVGMRRREPGRDDLVDARVRSLGSMHAAECGVSRRRAARADSAAPSRSGRRRGPDIRTTPMPPRPGGVAIATMVSSMANTTGRAGLELAALSRNHDGLEKRVADALGRQRCRLRPP